MFLLTFLLIPAGFARDAPCRPAEHSRDFPAAGERRVARQRPFAPVASPPLAGGPSGRPGLVPTRYAAARVGMKALYQLTPERGGPSRQSLEIVRTDAANVLAMQTAETAKYGRHVQTLTLNRFVESPPSFDQFNPSRQEVYLGDQVVTIGTKKLLCCVYENRNGFFVYRTLYCDEVPGQIVRHGDNASGSWKIRLQLLDVWD
ncbi:MAG: hypothetical protein JW849_05840 [Phycisphaerae bacterium]|nr:hypothetical protein [Phycisphaerae bacterium]